MSVNYNSSIVTSGLTLCLDAQNPRSYSGTGTIWSDVSGNRNNGTLVNGPTYNTTNYRSIVLDGINDYVVTTGFTPAATSTYSISIWVSPAAVTAGIQTIASVRQTSGPSDDFGFDIILNASSLLELRWNSASSSGGITGTTMVNNGAYNITLSYTSGASVYWNNSLVYTSSLIDPAGRNLTIGSMAGDTPSLFFNGKIMNIYSYNRALSASEVNQNFNALRGRYGI